MQAHFCGCFIHCRWPVGPWRTDMRPCPPLGAPDLIAGAVVAVLLIPQSLAYAMLAGLSAAGGPVRQPAAAAGLRSALGSSPVLGLGPVAVLALMNRAGAVGGLPAGVSAVGRRAGAGCTRGGRAAGGWRRCLRLGCAVQPAGRCRRSARLRDSAPRLMIAASQVPVMLGQRGNRFRRCTDLALSSPPRIDGVKPG